MNHKQRNQKILWILMLCFIFQSLAGIAYAIDPMQVDDFVRRADHGDVQAEYVLGISFLKGDGIVQNDFLAKQYLKLAAAQGHQEAQTQLDKMIQKTKPIIALQPNFDRTLPLQPKISQNIETTPMEQADEPQKERGDGRMFLVFELALGVVCVLLGFQGLRKLGRFLLPKKQKVAKASVRKPVYKIISDFKGRL